MDEKTHIFRTTVTMEREGRGHIRTGNGLDLPFSSPPVFDGFESTLTPEEAFVGSVNTCFMLTFAIMCKKLKTDLIEYACEAEGVLEKPEKGGWHFTEVVLRPRFTLSRRVDVERLLDLAERYCLVTASIKCRVTVEPQPVILEG